MTVTVYSKPACVQCAATTRALDRQVPVVVAGETHWAGFRPDMISTPPEPEV